MKAAPRQRSAERQAFRRSSHVLLAGLAVLALGGLVTVGEQGARREEAGPLRQGTAHARGRNGGGDSHNSKKENRADAVRALKGRDFSTEWSQARRTGGWEAMERVLREWRESDPAAAFSAVAALPDEKRRTEALAAVAVAWAKCEVREAVRGVEEKLTGEARRSVLVEVLVGVAATESDLVIDTLRQLGGAGERGQLADALVARLLPGQALLASRLVAEVPEAGDSLPLVSAVAGSLTGESAQRALDWAAGLENSQARHCAVEQVTQTLALSCPRDAVELGLALVPQYGAQPLLGAVETWAGRDAGAALTWAGRIDDAGLRSQAVAVVGRQLGTEAPDLALEFLLGRTGDSGVRAEWLREIAAQWSSQHPAAAGAYLDRAGANPPAPIAAGVVEGLAAVNPADSAAWILRLGAGAVSPDLAAQVVLSWFTIQPDAAGTWAKSYMNRMPAVEDKARFVALVQRDSAGLAAVLRE